MRSSGPPGSSPHTIQRTQYVDGYIAYTFRPPAAEAYLSRLLSDVTADRLIPIFNRRAILVPRTYLHHDFETCGVQEPVLLDYLVDPTMGTVVPQRLPPPTRHGDKLQPPIFFTQSDGSVGIALSDALSLVDGLHTLGSNQSIGSDSDNAILVLNWPGYIEYSRKQMFWDTRSGHHTVRRLSQQVASFLASFLENPPMKLVKNDQNNVQWVVGSAWKEFVMIVGLIHVSSTPNVWMPIVQTRGGFFCIY